MVTFLPSSAPRPLLAVLLIVALALAGVGRGLAAAADGGVAPGFGVFGASVPICHKGSGGAPIPPDGARHEGCDICALLAPLALANAPDLTGPASAVHDVAHHQAMAWVPAIARPRSPRQSQGPPPA